MFVTLGYLSLQMRQASRNQKSLMQQGRTARYVEILSARTQPHLAECFFLAMRNADLDDAQFVALNAHIDTYFWHFEDCYLQFEAGTIDQASWESDLATITAVVGLPAFRAEWKSVRALSSGRYREYMDSLMREVPVGTVGDWRERWSARLAEVLATATQSRCKRAARSGRSLPAVPPLRSDLGVP